MESAVRSVFREVTVGKILIQRNEKSVEKCAVLFYSKLPPTIASSGATVLLLDPMLATGGSALAAISVLNQAGVDDARIIFVCLIAAPEGLQALQDKHPKLRMVAGMIDIKLNHDKFILPGVGDFGDRYFGTQS